MIPASQGAPSLVALANEQVSILIACRLAGVRVADDDTYGRSLKVHCPFGITHSDGGGERAMRIYPDSNHAWCFACHAFYTPVKMTAHDRGLSWHEAAGLLLDTIGWKAPTLAERWAEATTNHVNLNLGQLADALKLYCRRIIPGWSTRQFDRAEAGLLSRCLELLDQVRTEEEAQLWLNTAKTVMSRAFAPCSASN